MGRKKASKPDEQYFAMNRCNHNQYQEMGVSFTRHELRKLWNHLEQHPELIDETEWLKEKLTRAQDLYAADLKSMGNALSLSELSTVDGLEVTGHAGLYYLDLYATILLFIVSSIILYPKYTSDTLIRLVFYCHEMWHDIPPMYSFILLLCSLAALITFFALGPLHFADFHKKIKK